MGNRILITGIGLVTPIGIGNKEVFDALCQGKTNMEVISFGNGEEKKFVVGKVPLTLDNFFEHYDKFKHKKDEEGKNPITKKEIRRMDRVSYLAVIASLYAISDAGFDIIKEENVGIVSGCGMGGVESIEEGHKKTIIEERGPGPFYIPRAMPNSICFWLAREFNCDGPSFNVSTACASGTHAIGAAYQLVKEGICEVVLCGGAEAALTQNGLEGFLDCGAISRRIEEPEKASRPFDEDRDGFVPSEGAAFLVIESEKHYKKRKGKNAYAEISGFGMSTDKGKHITHPNPETMKLALKRAFPLWVRLEDIDYINAHGTGTRINDSIEIAIYKDFFKEYAENILVNSTKSMLGHSLGATGAIETAVTAMSIREGKVHPTKNLENLDSECSGMEHVTKTFETDIKIAVKSSFAFGGHNAVLVMEKYIEKEKIKNICSLTEASESVEYFY